jgi:chromosome partitioning protein
MNELLRFVRQLIKEGTIRPSELEQRFGISQALVSKLGKGKRGPTLETLQQILRVYGYSLSVQKGDFMSMVSRVFTFFNNAGGVAKTTTARELGIGLALQGFRVLLVDLDSQGSLTKWLGVEDANDKIELERTAFHTVTTKRRALPSPIRIHNLDLIPASILLSELDLGLQAPALLYLRNNLLPYKTEYDYILIDSPPSLGTVSQVCALAADGLIVPMSTDAKSIEGYNNLLEFKEKFGDLLPGVGMSITAHIATKHNDRTSTARAMLELIETTCTAVAPVLGPLEHYAVYDRAIAVRKPVLLLEPGGVAARQLRSMVDAFVSLTKPIHREVVR